MAKVNRNVLDMRVPDYAYTDRHDGRVFVIVIDDDGTRHKRTLGHMTNSTRGQERMIPTQYFRDHYQNEYKEAYPDEKIPPHELSIGMYALVLGIIARTGLYSILSRAYGPMYANSLLDYAMYSIIHRSGTTHLFESVMARQVLFCNKTHSDAWYSDFFSEKLDEDIHHHFRIQWIQNLVGKGLKSVWLSIDGSNNDCGAKKSSLAEFGFPKSHNKAKTVVGYMYAMDANTGLPVTYQAYNGSVPDCQAIQKMAVFLAGLNLRIEGIILDRGFATEPVFETIESYGWKYIVMLPGDTLGHKLMMEQYSEAIRWKSRYALDDDILFGVTDRKRLFRAHDRESDISLYFNGVNGSIHSSRLMKRIQTEKKRLKDAIAKDKKAKVANDLQKYLELNGKGRSREVIVHFEAWDDSMSSKGFFSMATSPGITVNEAHILYSMRDVSETQFSILKSQEGADTTRVHDTNGIYGKFAVAFIASIIRFEIQSACKQLDLDTSPMIQCMDRIVLLHTAQGKYESVRNLTVGQRALLNNFGIDQDDIERLARQYNRRSDRDAQNPDRTMPTEKLPLVKENSHRRGRIPSSEKGQAVTLTPPAEKSKGGRPKGKKDSKPRKPRSDKGKIRGPHSKK